MNQSVIGKNFGLLFKKEMSRKQFLLYMGVTLLTITGIPSILKMITHPVSNTHQSLSPQGFGAGVYGGKRKESIG